MSIVALCLSIAAIVVVLALAHFQPQLTDAQIAARVASAEAQANEAKVKARVADDNVKSICAQLKAAGMKNVDCH